MPDWLFGLTVPQVMVLAIAVFVGGTWLGAFLVRPILRLFARDQHDWNSLVSVVLSCFGVFYGLLLGLLAVAAYDSRSKVEDMVSGEALFLAGFYRELADAYPPPLAAEFQAEVREYFRVTIEEDWPKQQVREIPTGGTAVMARLLRRIRAFRPSDDREIILHQGVLHSAEKSLDLRRMRLYSITTGLPGVLWYVVLMGAVINIFLIYLFNLRFINLLLLCGILSFFVATVIGLILVLDRPLQGPRCVDAEPFVLVNEFVLSRPGRPR